MSASAIDYMVTNFPDGVGRVVNINPDISDHFVQMLHYNVEVKNRVEMVVKPRHRWRQDDSSLKLLRESLTLQDWRNAYATTDAHETVRRFLDIVVDAFDASCARGSNSGLCTHAKKWITPEVIRKGKALKDLFWLKTNVSCPAFDDYYKAEKKDCWIPQRETTIPRKFRTVGIKREPYGIL